MSRIFQIVDGRLKIDPAAIEKLFGENYDEWRVETLKANIELLKLDPGLVDVHASNTLEEMVITKLLALNLIANNHLRQLSKRFFDNPPERTDINELRSWLDNTVNYFDTFTLKEFLASCILDLLQVKHDQGRWMSALTIVLQGSKRPGVCMYPSCGSLRQTFVCNGCFAQFCSQKHLDMAVSKKYHFHI